MINKDEYNMAQLCEIAYILGQFKESGKIVNLDKDIEEMFVDVYKSILDEWENGVENKVFLNTEEEGYIGAYAQRRLLELYGIKEGV